MKTYHIVIDSEKGVDTDRHADNVLKSLNQPNAYVSYSHGTGPAVIICDLDDKDNPDQAFTIKNDQGAFILNYKEIKPDAKQEQVVGEQPGTESGVDGAGTGTSSDKTTTKRRS